GNRLETLLLRERPMSLRSRAGTNRRNAVFAHRARNPATLDRQIPFTDALERDLLRQALNRVCSPRIGPAPIPRDQASPNASGTNAVHDSGVDSGNDFAGRTLTAARTIRASTM